ncbi:MAG: MFS transporter [Pseudomonadota bacterium]
MRIATLSLYFVIMLDVMGQGLVIPVLTTLLLDPSQTLLDTDTSTGMRELYFGITMGVFFLSWFLGAAYISKLSDFIGRKQGILICLVGGFVGYGLTIVALYTSSFPLLLVARIITGFTAGNQPISQAALVDQSSSDEEKTKRMGLVIVAVSMGLLVGPILGGALTDQNLLGDLASVQAPFYAAAALVAINILLIVIFFHNINFEPRKVTIKITDVFLTLYHVAKRPVVLRLSLVFFCSQLALNTFFVFLDNFLFSRFQFDTAQNSIILIVFGIGMAASGAFLVAPLAMRFPKREIIYVTLLIMAIGLVIVMVNPVGILSYAAILPFVVAFGINYPLMLSLFSASVDEHEQGWVMGVTVALYTLGAGIMSLIGGQLMAMSIYLPYSVSILALVIAAILIFVLWRGESFRNLDPR